MKDKFAKVVRIITVPPVLVLEILFLVLVPVSAYPLASLKAGEET